MTASDPNDAVPAKDLLRIEKKVFIFLPFLLACGQEALCPPPAVIESGAHVASYFVIPAKDFGEPFGALRYAHGVIEVSEALGVEPLSRAAGIQCFRTASGYLSRRYD